MSAPHDQHVHAADLEVFLDFVNSLEYDDGAPHEHLPAARDAIAFLAGRGLAHRDELERSIGDGQEPDRRLERLRAVRAAAREVWDALVERRDADPAAIDRFNQALRHRPIVELVPGAAGCGVGHRHVGDPWDEALARVLEPFVESVAQGHGERFRICANDGCRWVFYDESRAGRRRWCSMASCGNRAKAARHRARRRTEPDQVA